MNESRLLREFVRVRLTPARINIEVKRVEASAQADEPPSIRWSLAAALPTTATALMVDRARMTVLADYRYFHQCENCNARVPAGTLIPQADGDPLCEECVKGEE